MKSTTIRAWALGSTLLAATATCGLTAQPARAESKLINTPAEKYAIAPGGVDMRTGRYVYSQTDLSIGGEKGGLALTRIRAAGGQGHSNPFGGFSHNWDVMITERRLSIDEYNPQNSGPDYRIGVHFGGRSETFQAYANSGGFAQVSQGALATLTYTGVRDGAAVYTYTAADGTIALFRPMGAGGSRSAFVSEITEPDGTKYVLDYGDDGRLKSAVSSRGYALLLEMGGGFVAKACVLNLAATALPGSGLCPPGAPATASYGYNGGKLSSVADAANAVSSFTYATRADGAATMGFVKPGQAAPWLTNVVGTSYDEEGVQWEVVGEQDFADGQKYAYRYDTTPPVSNRISSIAGGIYTDALGHSTFVTYGFPVKPGTNHCGHPPCGILTEDNIVRQQTSGPVQIEDPLGRKTILDYCEPQVLIAPPPNNGCQVTLLQFFKDPEGAKTELAYDGNRNVTQVKRYPKPGALDPNGQTPAPIVTSAVYDTAHPKSADKPLSITDARGNTTSFTYAPEHGGVLTETGPAVNNVTPQKRYAYAQRTAVTASGAAAGPPVWLLTQMSTCRTGNPHASGTGCALGAGDEVITGYDYGPTTGPNNLLLRATTVTADGYSLRTCVTYDPLGNKISQTSPRGGCQ